jgi:uncharacterized protein YkwD
MNNRAFHGNWKKAALYMGLAGLLLAQYVGMASIVQAAPPRTFTPPPMSAGYELNAMEQKAVLLLNTDRRNAGLEPLKINLKLSKLAADYAADMNNRKFFSHVDPEGKDPFDRMAAIGIDFPNEGENIALSPDVETAQKMLMDSPLHRENILNPKFTEIGIGVRTSASRGGIYLVQDFVGQ